MRLRRPWLLIMLAGCSWAHVSRAQTGLGQPGAGQPGAADGGLFGNPPATPPTNPTLPPTTPDTTDEPPEKPKPKTPPADEGPKPSNPFGFDNPTPDNTTGTTRPPGRNGASTTFGPERKPDETTDDSGSAAKKRTEDNGPDFTAPGLLGAQRQSFSSGSGRFAKPKYRYGVTMGVGFDDNYLAIPDITGQPGSEFTQVIPAVPEVAVFQDVRVETGSRRAPNGTLVPTFQVQRQKIVLRPFQPEQTIITPIPGIPSTPRASSIVSTANVYFNTQFAKPREALTFDLRLGTEYYWDRKKDPADFNGSLSVLYVRKLSPRMQFTTNANLIHQSQPDFSVVNVNSNNVGHSFTNGFLKFDLGYRWSPRFSTDTSLNVQALYYDEKLAGLNFIETTLSNEFRYIKSRKTTYVFELRYANSDYPDAPTLKATSEFLLVGLEQKWSRRLASSFRLGEAVRSFEAGGSQSTPYGELSLSYQLDSRSQLSLTSRYGFEQSQSVTDKNITFRTSFGYSHLFTRRLNANFNINYVDQQFTSDLTNTQTYTTTTDANLGLSYQVNRRLSLNANLSYTMLKSTLGLQDYDRTRFFVTGSYDF